MITRERLEELIEQGATIYNTDYLQLGEIHLNKNDYVEQNGTLHTKLYQCGFNYFYNERIFETKEEALFVIKYHKTKTLYFEPPTFEEFLKTGDDERFPHWDCDDISIVEWTDENRFLVDMYGDRDVDKFFYYGNDDWEDNRKEAYCKAVEYAMKLFLGEEI